MSLPDWVRKFRELKTEIKLVKGNYYKYLVEYRYNPEKKITAKLTGILLSKITEQDGFIPSDKKQMRAKIETKLVDIKNYGLFQIFSMLAEDELGALKKVFQQDVCELLFSFSMFRWACNTLLKRAPYYYTHDFCAHALGAKSVDEKAFSNVLNTVGEQRTKVVEWMKYLLGKDGDNGAEFVMMDSTHIHSKSDLLIINAKRYNLNFDFER